MNKRLPEFDSVGHSRGMQAFSRGMLRKFKSRRPASVSLINARAFVVCNFFQRTDAVRNARSLVALFLNETRSEGEQSLPWNPIEIFVGTAGN